MDDIRLKRFEMNDLPEVQRLILDAWGEKIGISGTDIEQRAAEQFAVHYAYTASYGLLYSSMDSVLLLFMIESHHKRMGIGSALENELISHYASLGAKNMGVETNTFCDYKYYERMGWNRQFSFPCNNRVGEWEYFYYTKDL